MTDRTDPWLDEMIATIEAGGEVSLSYPNGLVERLGTRHLDDLYLAREARRFMDEALRTVPCPLCGGPLGGHDWAACDEKMRNWKPLGILGSRGQSGEPVALGD